MNYTAISSFINVLSTIRPECQDLITQLNHYFNFDHNIYLVDSTDEVDRFISSRRDGETIPRSVYIFKSVNGNITGTETLIRIKSKNIFLVVATANFNFEHNINLLLQIRQIHRLKKTMKIGVFFSYTANDDLQKLFEWCWKYQIINIFVASYQHPEAIERLGPGQFLSIFTFNPFGSFDVINVTGSKEYDTFFLSQKSNFQQHPLRQAQICYESSIDEKLWQAVLSVLNASIKVVNTTLDAGDTKSESIDIMKCLSLNQERFFVEIYPLVIDGVVIVVPEALPYSELAAYLGNVISDNILAYFLLEICVVMLLLSLFRFIEKKTILFFQSVADVLNLLMNDNAAIKYQHLSRIEVLLIVPLTVAGFFIVNAILSAMQSYVTRPILQPQINTIEDIYKSPFPILSAYPSMTKLTTHVLGNLSNYRDWGNKFQLVDKELFEREIGTYNTSISFILNESTAKMLIHVQKRWKIRGYHIPQLRIRKYVASYVVNNYFPFIERLNEIIHWIRSAGLYEVWWRQEIDASVDNVAKYSEVLQQRKELDVESFPIPKMVLYGWATSIIVFVIEIIWKNFGLSVSKKVLAKMRYLRANRTNKKLKTEKLSTIFEINSSGNC